MKDSHKYSLYRINTLLTLFRSEYAIYTVTELAQMLEVPKSVIREDIYTLAKGLDECETIIFSYEDDEEEDFLDRLKKGLADDVPLGAYSRFKADIFLPLELNELNVLDDFCPDEQYDLRFLDGGVYIKSSPLRENQETRVKIAELDKYINENKTLEINYQTKDGQFREMVFKPLCIVRYSFENVSYVVTVKADYILPLRIDRIKCIKVSEKSVEIEDFSPLKKLGLMWKMDTSEEVKVKLKIMGPKHIRMKIKNDIFNMRISHDSIISSKLHKYVDLDESEYGEFIDYPDEEYSIFEGNIIGLTAFKNWLYGYGSAVLVMSPESLREEIIESLEKRCKIYS